jgi:hypothetical protein
MAVGNLELINVTEVTSAVSTLEVEDIFSANFDIYKVVMNDFSVTTTTDVETFLRFINSSGSVVSSSDYDRASFYMKNTTGSFSEIKSTNDTKIHYAVGSLDPSPQGGSSVHYIFNPYSSSSYTFDLNQSASFYSNPRFVAGKGIGVLKQTSSITGLQIILSGTNTISSGVVSTYGLASN